MRRLLGLTVLVFIAGCDADVTRVRTEGPPARDPAPEPEPTDPQQRDPIGPLPQPEPSYRKLAVHLVNRESGAPAQGVEVLSHDLAGAMIERLQTDDEGNAAIGVEDGGTVSILWENQAWIEDPARHVATFRVTQGLETLNRALQGVRSAPNPPIDVVLDIDQVPGATQYVAQLSCASQIVATELPIVFSGYTGCEGQKSFSAIVNVYPADGVSRWASLSDLPLPDTGSVTHTLSPVPVSAQTFTVTLLGMPAESYAFALFERTTDNLHGPFWSDGDGWTDGLPIEWTGEVAQLELPVQVSMHMSFDVGPDCTRVVRRDGFTEALTSFSWTPDRLASGSIVAGEIQLGEGDTPDIAAIGFGGERGGQLRGMSFFLPWTPGAQGPVPTVHVELPADLEELYGIDGEPGAVESYDVLDAVGYEAALASDPRALTEVATSRDCLR
jgi:hypothetical protein